MPSVIEASVRWPYETLTFGTKPASVGSCAFIPSETATRRSRSAARFWKTLNTPPSGKTTSCAPSPSTSPMRGPCGSASVTASPTAASNGIPGSTSANVGPSRAPVAWRIAQEGSASDEPGSMPGGTGMSRSCKPSPS
ncbi:hypothetical protein BE20_16175 [Sorangium cellulosum]|nr:hypothetical protein BE20_16175 [Sorangium cellulosum]